MQMSEDSAGSAALRPEELATYFALMETATLLQFAVDQQLRESGDLSYVQFQILAQLRYRSEGTQRMTDLADSIVHSRSGLTYQVNRLTDRGLVTRDDSPDDDRSVLVSLTEAGCELVEAVMPGHRRLVRERLFDQLSEEECADLGALLGRARDVLWRGGPRSSATARVGRRLGPGDQGCPSADPAAD